jgi:hypothetical protein
MCGNTPDKDFARGVARGGGAYEMQASQAMGPRHWHFMRFSKTCGAANGKYETSRGRNKSVSRDIRSEASAPKSIIQEGKKVLRCLMIVFMEIRAVTGFSGEM